MPATPPDTSVDILLAEDSPTQAEHIASLLRTNGFRVTLAAHGQEALAAMRRQAPQLLISDVNMPMMDGYQLCRAVRRDRDFAGIPVILLTSLSDPEDVFRALECGADNFITKPCDEDYLLARIQHLLSNQHLRDREQIEVGLEMVFAGRRHLITADRMQILNLLLSTYEAAMEKNRELLTAQESLRLLNERLEDRVEQRTEALRKEVAERQRAESEVRQLNQELEQRVRARTAELVAANQELDSFAHSVSHDLRAPLRAIKGFADILLSSHAGELSAEPRRLLHVVVTSAERMGRLIDDLLLFARTSRQSLRKQRVSMNALVAEAIASLEPATAGRKVTFAVETLPDCSGDHALLQQVWINLLSNAVKFTLPRPEARIEVLSEQRGGETIYVVKDNGVGFDPQYARRLFGVFERLHRMDEFEGTGVGLSIVHRILARHGGRIWTDSKPDVGATFYFTLPTGEFSH